MKARNRMAQIADSKSAGTKRELSLGVRIPPRLKSSPSPFDLSHSEGGSFHKGRGWVFKKKKGKQKMKIEKVNEIPERLPNRKKKFSELHQEVDNLQPGEILLVKDCNSFSAWSSVRHYTRNRTDIFIAIRKKELYIKRT